MNSNFRKYLAIICVVSVTASFLMGCNKSNEVKTPAATTEEDSSTIMGEVTAVNGNKITLTLGELADRKNTGNRDAKDDDAMKGTPSSGSPDDDTTDSTPPSGNVASDNAPRDAPPSGAPQDDEGGNRPSMNGFVANGTETSILIEDEKVIVIQSDTGSISGSLEDITVGVILTISYDNNGKIQEITVISQGNARDIPPSSTEETSTPK